MKKLVAFAAALIAAAALLAPALASAEEEVRPCRAGVTCLDETVIRVQVPRPQAFYVVNRQRLEHQGAQAEQSFTQDVVESVDQGPF